MYIWKYKISTNKINKSLFETNKKNYLNSYPEILNFSLSNHYSYNK